MDGHDRLAAVVGNGRISRFGSEDLGPVLESPLPLPGSHARFWRLCSISACPSFSSIFFLGHSEHSSNSATHRHPSLPPERTRSFLLLQLITLVAILAVAGWSWFLLSLTTLRGSVFVPGHLAGIDLVQVATFVGFLGGFVAAFMHMLQHAKHSIRLGSFWAALVFASMAFLIFVGVTYHLLSFNTNV